MTFLEQIVRIFLGGQPKKCLIRELFQNEADAEIGIVLEETGFPYGGVTTCRWWKSNTSGFFEKIHRGFNETDTNPDGSIVVQDSAERVDELFAMMEEFGQLENYRGSVRDGVIYRVAWGTKNHQRSLTIKNPPADSTHYQFVTRLRENAWK